MLFSETADVLMFMSNLPLQVILLSLILKVKQGLKKKTTTVSVMKSSDITQIIYDLYPIKWTILGILKIYDMLNDSEHVFQILYVYFDI